MPASRCCRPSLRVLGQQLAGVADGRQRVADLVRDGGRQAAHRSQFQLLRPLLNRVLILQKDDELARLRGARLRAKRARRARAEV
jgi:hypothetical protein